MVLAYILFEDADYSCADMIVLPGGGLGMENLNKHTELLRDNTDTKQGKLL